MTDKVWGSKYNSQLNTKEQYKYLGVTYPDHDVVDGVMRPGSASQEDFIASTEVRAAMDQLPDDLRKTLILYYFQEEPVKDIARILDITEDAVYKRLSRAREELKEILSA